MRWVAWVAAAGLLGCGGSGGAASADAGSGNVGNTDAGAFDAGPQDAGADAGYSGADCTGIVPASVGSGYTFDAPPGACSATAGDGAGVIAALGGSPTPSFWVYDARGAEMGTFDSPLALPQASGFIGVVATQSGHAIATFDENGKQTPGMPLASGAVVTPAWHGGAIAFSGGSSGLTAQLFDSGANPLASVTAGGVFTALGGAQDAGGRILALADGVRGVWLDPSSGTAGAPFDIGSGSAVIARALAGGGVAVRIDGHWAATLQPGDTSLHAAPPWLRDGDDFSLVRGDEAYAIARGASVKLVSALGNGCGATSFADQAAIDFGLDGTVIGSSGSGGCTKVFWPGLLK